jgi:predicted flap endonuclease-1-like 5' DNA nuclease
LSGGNVTPTAETGSKGTAVEILDSAPLADYCGGNRWQAVGEKTGINEKQLLEWSNMADMMRISGVGPQYAELLEASGVDTVKELQHRNAENLATKMSEVNAEKKLAKSSPASSMVQGWIDQAGSLKATITH